MSSLKVQFFFLFGSFAAVQPFLALLFKERGLGEEQIGYTLGMAGWAIMLSPAVITLVADTRVQPRRLLAILCLATGAALVAMLMSGSYWMLLAFFFLYSLSVTAMLPLQDGITFGFQRLQRDRGEVEVHYNSVRVWGTFGYMALLVALFYPMKLSGEVSLAIWFGVGCFALLFLNTFRMPDRGKRETAKRAQGLPTGDALRALFGRKTAVFSVGMILLLMASAAYHTMYPVYLSENLGLAKHWIGIVIMSGAVIEVFCILGLTRLERRWGLRAVMLGALVLTALRFGLMYAYPNLLVAVGAQVFHGAMICAMMVIPPNYINGLATEENRNSIQGVYTMLVVGSSRFLGTALSGHVAAIDQRLVHLLCAVLSVGALALMWIGFRPELKVDR